MRVSTTLTAEGQQAFATTLKASVDAACAKRANLKAELKRHLGWHSLYRLSQYANGKHFPTANIVRKIGECIEADRLELLARAGYYSNVIDSIYEVSIYDDAPGRKIRHDLGLHDLAEWSPVRVAVAYAVALFPQDRDERARQSSWYVRALNRESFEAYADEAHEKYDGRNRLHRFLKYAKLALGDEDLDRESALFIAGRWVRAWARSVDREETERVERMMFVHRLDPLPIDEVPSDAEPRLVGELADILQKTGGPA